jgi:hypothetical protein
MCAKTDSSSPGQLSMVAENLRRMEKQQDEASKLMFETDLKKTATTAMIGLSHLRGMLCSWQMLAVQVHTRRSADVWIMLCAAQPLHRLIQPWWHLLSLWCLTQMSNDAHKPKLTQWLEKIACLHLKTEHHYHMLNQCWGRLCGGSLLDPLVIFLAEWSCLH